MGQSNNSEKIEKSKKQVENSIINRKWFYVSFIIPLENTFSVINSPLGGDTPTQVVINAISAPGLPIEEKHPTASEEYPPDVSLGLKPDENDSFPTTYLQGLPFVHAKFVDKREEDSEIDESEVRIISKEEGRNYAFTPKNFVKYAEKGVFKNVEFQLVGFFNLQQTHDEYQSREDKSHLTFTDGKPAHTKSDGIYMFKYLIEDRIKLYKEDKRLEKEVFAPVALPRFMKWLRNKREQNDLPHLERYCSEVEKLLDKYDVTPEEDKKGFLSTIKESLFKK